MPLAVGKAGIVKTEGLVEKAVVVVVHRPTHLVCMFKTIVALVRPGVCGLP
jgi:hypothetical protein